MGLGKFDNVRPGELAGMLYNETGAPDGVIGKIHLFNKHTLVDIDEDWAEKIVRGARKARYRGRPFRIRFDELQDGDRGQ
jgi:ATP-dependent RNA helicase DeaD